MNTVTTALELIDSILNDNSISWKNNDMYLTYGPKTINGIETGDYSIIFHVKQKKSLSELLPEQIIPSSFTIDDFNVVTDVKLGELCGFNIVDCHDRSTFNAEPVATNRRRTRPLKGGASSINSYESGYVATLGLIARDKSDGQIVAISNNHVFAGSTLHPSYQSTFSNVLPLCAIQPAYENASYRTSNDFIGTVKKFVPIGDVDYTKSFLSGNPHLLYTSSDSAVVSLTSYGIIDSSSAGIIGFDPAPPYAFATDAEINSLLDPNSVNYAAPVFRSGRTCGPVGSPGNTYSCKLSAYQFGLAWVGLYSGHTSYFQNSIYLRGNVVSGRGGDSGSPVLAYINGAWKVIGLFFAGPGDVSYGIACRITSIASKLNLTYWDTKMPTVSAVYKVQNINALEYGTANDASYVTLSGRKYFFVAR